jgi:hypothetical protein
VRAVGSTGAFSPDGRPLATPVSPGGPERVAVVELGSGRWTLVPGLVLDGYRSLAWSPSGLWLYLARGRQVLAWRPGAAAPFPLPIKAGGTVMSIATTERPGGGPKLCAARDTPLREFGAVAWEESHSLSFSARHDSAQAEQAAAVLAGLEVLRDDLAGLFEHTPGDIAVVLHPRPAALTLAHPWLPLARLVAAPASRRYFAGWFGEREIHVLSPPALERRASSVPGSREALLLSPEHEYSHLVIGANNPHLPPPFSPSAFRRYVRWAWLCEGAATWLSGQAPHLRPAIVRRLREGGRPTFPPDPRDAMLLGGTVFELLEREHGSRAAARLATAPLERGPRSVLVDAFGSQLAGVEREWRASLDALTAS